MVCLAYFFGRPTGRPRRVCGITLRPSSRGVTSIVAVTFRRSLEVTYEAPSPGSFSLPTFRFHQLRAAKRRRRPGLKTGHRTLLGRHARSGHDQEHHGHHGDPNAENDSRATGQAAQSASRFRSAFGQDDERLLEGSSGRQHNRRNDSCISKTSHKGQSRYPHGVLFGPDRPEGVEGNASHYVGVYAGIDGNHPEDDGESDGAGERRNRASAEGQRRKASGRKDRRREARQAIACHAELAAEQSASGICGGACCSQQPSAENARFGQRDYRLIQNGASAELRDRLGLYRRNRFHSKFFLLNGLEHELLYRHEDSPEFAYRNVTYRNVRESQSLCRPIILTGLPTSHNNLD